MEIHNLGTKPFGNLLQLVLPLTTSIFSVTAVSLGPSKAATRLCLPKYDTWRYIGRRNLKIGRPSIIVLIL